MKYLQIITRWLDCVVLPLRKNLAFFVFMFVLGYTCHRWGTPTLSELGLLELFLDLYVLCVVLSLLPWKIRRWVRAVLYVVFYATSIIDMYCIVKFHSTFSPTMLLLMSETTVSEASEFLQSYLTWDIVGSELGKVLLILLVHVIYSLVLLAVRGRGYRPRIRHARLLQLRALVLPLAGIGILWTIEQGVSRRMDNKQAFARMMSIETVGDLEKEMFHDDRAELYLPVYRFAFSFFANNLASKQIEKLEKAVETAVIDSCTYRCPNIVLIIGESYNRHHSQLYGYSKPTTPRQLRRAEDGQLTVFTDVVSPYNLTSLVFKHLMSLYAVGDDGEWCDYPMFPRLFREAGFHVAFITNQFLARPGEQLYDFSGGFFLNHPKLSSAMFDVRNKRLHVYDHGILNDYDKLVESGRISFDGDSCRHLVIFHLIGQHVSYPSRCPARQRRFAASDYDRPGYSGKERALMAAYDNATQYNDSVVDAIIRRFEDKDAVVIYLSDHGDECFGEGVHAFGRLHTPTVDYRQAHEEFEVPFWVWWSKAFAEARPALVSGLREASGKPFMTDRLAHLLLWLGGIHTPQYREKYNPLSPAYDEACPRMLKNVVDYNELKRKHEEKDTSSLAQP